MVLAIYFLSTMDSLPHFTLVSTCLVIEMTKPLQPYRYTRKHAPWTRTMEWWLVMQLYRILFLLFGRQSRLYMSKNDTFIAKYCQSSRSMGIGWFYNLLKLNICQIFIIKFNIVHTFCKILMPNNKSFSGVRASFQRASSKLKIKKIIPDVNNGIMGN